MTLNWKPSVPRWCSELQWCNVYKIWLPDRLCCLKYLAKLCALVLLIPFAVSGGSSDVLVVRHVTLIDGTGRPPLLNQTIVIKDGIIKETGDSRRIRIVTSARVIEGAGKYLIPGLWDMHVHIAGVFADPRWSKEVLLPLLLANGVTGVRDMGGDLETLLSWKKEIETGKLLGPHIIASGPWLAVGGKKSPEQYPVSTAEEARAAVRDLKGRGADFIKFLTLPSREAFFALAAEAREQRLPFAGHLPLEVSAAEASSAGMRSIEHLYYSSLALSLSSRETELRSRLVEAQRKRDFDSKSDIMAEAIASYDSARAAKLWKTFKANRTWITPTLEGIYTAGHIAEVPRNQANFQFVPSVVTSGWSSGMRQDAAAMAQTKKIANLSRNDWKLTREMHDADVSLLAGSDSLDDGVIPGFSLHLELARLVEAGFSPAEALRTATLEAAKFLEQEKRLGTVESGKVADLVLLTADPTENISNTTKIFAVIRGGRYLSRQDLDNMLLEARTSAMATSTGKQ
jgi:imidazolonepropionase-like amidohydrolase